MKHLDQRLAKLERSAGYAESWQVKRQAAKEPFTAEYAAAVCDELEKLGYLDSVLEAQGIDVAEWEAQF